MRSEKKVSHSNLTSPIGAYPRGRHNVVGEIFLQRSIWAVFSLLLDFVAIVAVASSLLIFFLGRKCNTQQQQP